MARQQSAKKTGGDAVVASSRKRAAPPEVSESVENADNGIEDLDECSSDNEFDDVNDEPLDDEEWVAIENGLHDFDGPKPKKRKTTLNLKRSAAGVSISKGDAVKHLQLLTAK
jgi:hypothetical protein